MKTKPIRINTYADSLSLFLSFLEDRKATTVSFSFKILIPYINKYFTIVTSVDKVNLYNKPVLIFSQDQTDIIKQYNPIPDCTAIYPLFAMIEDEELCCEMMDTFKENMYWAFKRLCALSKEQITIYGYTNAILR